MESRWTPAREIDYIFYAKTSPQIAPIDLLVEIPNKHGLLPKL